MYRHRIIRIGGSVGITIPKRFLEITNLGVGDRIVLEMNSEYKTLLIKPSSITYNSYFLTPEYFLWLKKNEKELKTFKNRVRLLRKIKM